MEQLRARLEAERAERERLEQVRQELERDGQAMRARMRQLSHELSYRAPEQAPPEDPGDPGAREANAALQDQVIPFASISSAQLPSASAPNPPEVIITSSGACTDPFHNKSFTATHVISWRAVACLWLRGV